MRARRDAGMHARSRERGRSCRLQSARTASGRVGCYVGKFKFARGKGKQPRGRDMWATWTEQEWTGWRRDGGRERATRFNGQRNGRGRGRGRETPNLSGNRNRRHGNGNGPGQPEHDSPEPSKDRVPSTRTADGTVRPSLVSSLFPFPLPSSFFHSRRPPSLDLDGCRANPVIPPPGEMRGVPTLPTQPTPPHPTAAMLGGRALGCLRFCFDVLHDLRQKEQHNTPLPSGCGGPPWWSLPGREVDAVYQMLCPPA